MFEQTFTSDGNSSAPYTFGFSLLLQFLALAVMTLIPLIYTQILPSAQLRGLVAAPAPRLPKPPIAVQSRSTLPTRLFNAATLWAVVRAIPKTMAALTQDAPQIGITDAIDPNAVPNGILGFSETTPTAPPPLASAIRTGPVKGPIRVGTGVSEANLLRRVQPVYPPLARQTRVQGIVEFTATISKEGNIANLHLVRGHPLLVKAAVDAVLQWKYRPTLLNGEPVEVITDIIVNFTLTQ